MFWLDNSNVMLKPSVVDISLTLLLWGISCLWAIHDTFLGLSPGVVDFLLTFFLNCIGQPYDCEIKHVSMLLYHHFFRLTKILWRKLLNSDLFFVHNVYMDIRVVTNIGTNALYSEDHSFKCLQFSMHWSTFGI